MLNPVTRVTCRILRDVTLICLLIMQIRMKVENANSLTRYVTNTRLSWTILNLLCQAREDPYLANYKNAWPAEIYTAFYLHRRIHDTRFKERQQRQQKQSTGSSRQLQNHDDSFEGDDSDSDVEILDGPTNVSHHASRPVSCTIPTNTQDHASRAVSHIIHYSMGE